MASPGIPLCRTIKLEFNCHWMINYHENDSWNWCNSCSRMDVPKPSPDAKYWLVQTCKMEEVHLNTEMMQLRLFVISSHHLLHGNVRNENEFTIYLSGMATIIKNCSSNFSEKEVKVACSNRYQWHIVLKRGGCNNSILIYYPILQTILATWWHHHSRVPLPPLRDSQRRWEEQVIKLRYSRCPETERFCVRISDIRISDIQFFFSLG